ncbi:fatty acid desaturase family protein [Robbsia andropogonis]|nr:fatty acid desaturase family protein [Robbsia andropogonis]MCP1120859.1 fatty acid desaturase family protein [Robbsia andropogonis]
MMKHLSAVDATSATGLSRQAERARLASQHADLVDDLKMPIQLRCAWQISVQWLVIVIAIVIASAADSTALTIIALVVIATRQHALLVLMHDAAHYLISRHKRGNDLCASFLLTFPLTISTSRYRAHHLAHHRNLNTAADPDYADAFAPATRGQLWLALLRDVTGLSTLQSLRSIDSFGVFGLFQQRDASNRAERSWFIVFIATVCVVATCCHLWFDVLLYWIAPMVFFLPPILRIRSLSEHAGLANEPVSRDARSVSPGWFERALFAPCNINRHWEHHLFPQVPSYRLHELSRRLAERLPEVAAGQPTRGYLIGSASMLAELYHAPRDAHSSTQRG